MGFGGFLRAENFMAHEYPVNFEFFIYHENSLRVFVAFPWYFNGS